MKNDEIYRSINLDASEEYCKVLIQFLRGQKYQGFKIDSKVTPFVLSAVEDSITQFYSDKVIINKFSQAIAEQFSEDSPISRIVRKDVSQNAMWLQKEMNSLIASNFGGTISTEMEAQLIQNISIFIHSSAGETLIVALSKFLASGIGKILIPKIGAVIGKIVLSSAFKSIVVSSMKKIGVSVLVKSVVGKVIIVIMGILGITASIPIIYIILPIIGIIIAYEYNEMPRRLAEKIPQEITLELRGKFNEMNQLITEALVINTFKEISRNA